jgi:hypothetical protein
MDTSRMVAGTHTIQVRATDSNGLTSNLASVAFTIDEPVVQEDEPEGFLSGITLWVVVLVVIIIVVVAVAYVVRSRGER